MSLYQDCPHCRGEGFITVRLPEHSSLLVYLDGDAQVPKVCPHCVRRSVVPAVASEAPGNNGIRRRPRVRAKAKVSECAE
jgi:hypothetical protein